MNTSTPMGQRIVSISRLSKILMRSLWRRKLWTVPSLGLIGLLMVLAFLPSMASFRVYLIMAAGFGLLGFGVVYLGLRLFQYASLLATHIHGVSSSAPANIGDPWSGRERPGREFEERIWSAISRMQRSALENERELHRSLDSMSERIDVIEAALDGATTAKPTKPARSSENVASLIAELQASVDQRLENIEKVVVRPSSRQ